MFAKQTVLSASLVALLGAGPARAEPSASPQADDEAPPLKPPKRKRTGTFSIGAGMSSDEWFIATARLEQPDLFGTGKYLGLSATISSKREQMMLRYADPSVLGTPFALTADLYTDYKVMPGFTRRGSGFSTALTHPLGHNVHAFIGYRLEAIEAESLIVARSTDSAPTLRSGLLSAVRTGISYDTPGTSFGVSVERADQRLGSDFNETRLNAWANTHQPLGPFTLHLSGSFSAIADPSGVPLNERLFLGSSREVRGYRAYTLGPVDGLGRPIGGDTKVLGRAELELPIVRRIGLSVVGFADAGVVLDRTTGQGELGRSVGVGLLWRSPIGPLRFDWALPLDGGKPALVFGFGFGF